MSFLSTKILCSSTKRVFSLPAAYRLMQKNSKKPASTAAVTVADSNNVMALASKQWKQLPQSKKVRIIEEYHKKTAIPVKNEHQRFSIEHSNSDFNLIMKLLYSPKMRQGCREIVISGSFAGAIAKKALRLLSDEDKRRLREKFSVDPNRTKWNKSMYAKEMPLPVKDVSMSRHGSFREMFNNLYNDDPYKIFFAVAASASGMRCTDAFRETMSQKWNSMPTATKKLYQPVSLEERPAFERHCAAASLERDTDVIPILEFFCSFRRLSLGADGGAGTATSGGVADQTVLARARKLYQQDCRHTHLERVRFSMARAKKNLESDMVREASVRQRVVPRTYYTKSFAGKNEVRLAKKITQGRYGVTVFDEVINLIKKKS